MERGRLGKKNNAPHTSFDLELLDKLKMHRMGLKNYVKLNYEKI